MQYIKKAWQSQAIFNISFAFVGFMVNTGLAHGGNGFEAIEYLLNVFEDVKIENPSSRKNNVDL